MKKIISTKTHGIIDYGTAAGMLILPRFFRMDPFMRKILMGSAIVTTLYSLFTNYEMGIFKVLPMKVHLGLDAAQSAALAAVPVAFAENKKSALPVMLGLSMIEAAITMNTQTRPRRRFMWFRF